MDSNNTDKGSAEDLFYGKTDYDYGFAEFFFNEKKYVIKLTEAIPDIFTVYPNACSAKKICGVMALL
jgi:hypothetical protein